MKLTIEIEISPEEIPLATELFAILKQISSNVKPKNSIELFKTLILQLEEDAANIDAVSKDINILLQEIGVDNFDDFFIAFTDAVFDPDLVIRSQSVVPFFGILTRLPEPQKTMMRDKLIPKVLKFLTIKRTIDANRMDFFAYADAFAALVRLEFVSIAGAVTTITTLLQKTETRCAAVTMLGKTVELCLNLLTEKCEPQKLQELRVVLQTVNEETFRYDVNYIEENMNWKTTSPTSSKLTAERAPVSELYKTASPFISQPFIAANLIGQNSFVGHNQTIFAICYDEVRDQVVSSGKDGQVILWTKEGKTRERVNIQRHYACSMDINARQKSLFICGVPKDTYAQPAIICYSLTEKGINLRGTLEKENTKLISCVKSLIHDSGNFFVTGETSKSQMEREKVRVYDANSNQPFEKLQPLITYDEHEDIITSLTNFPNKESLFFSGSRDFSIKLWDKRQPKSASSFGIYQPALKRVVAHEGMITCLDAFDNILVSGGLDKRLVVWDLRALDPNRQPLMRVSIDDTAILKCAIGPTSSTAAVSSLKGIYVVDFTNGTSTPIGFKDNRTTGRYHDLKWNVSRGILYAAGDDFRVDQYTTVSTQNW